MQYAVYEFFTRNEIERSWLVSIFTDYHFEGFEETSDSIKGFVPAEKIRDLLVKEILYDNDFHHIRFTSALVEDKNWNEEWERNYEPVVIADRVTIRTPFHNPARTEYEIIIEPKMSFGTGHHATTASMIELMLKEDFENKHVLDFGSGTGVLAIFAEKLKAAKITAIDNEEWAYNNCIENTSLNSCVNIKTVYGDDTFIFREKFDVILANINRNLILKNISNWKKLMKADAVLLVSGILLSDEKDVIQSAALNNLKVKDIVRKDGWLAIAFR